MRALLLFGARHLRVASTEPPPAPGPGEVQIRVRAVGLNHIDVWGFRGMAFAKRKLPLVVGAEASGEVAALGDGVTGLASEARATVLTGAGNDVVNSFDQPGSVAPVTDTVAGGTPGTPASRIPRPSNGRSRYFAPS